MLALGPRLRTLGRAAVKKGRHRRYEEARAVKHTSTELRLDDIGFTEKVADLPVPPEEENDEYADIAARYGAFDDEDEPEPVDDER